MGHVHFTRIVVEVVDERLKQELETTALLGLETFLHRLGNRELIDLSHRHPPLDCPVSRRVDAKLEQVLLFGK